MLYSPEVNCNDDALYEMEPTLLDIFGSKIHFSYGENYRGTAGKYKL